MSTNFVQAITSGFVKLALLAGLVVLGIVFVPDGFVGRIQQAIDRAGNYLQGEAVKHLPKVESDFSQQTRETKGDVDELYQTLKGKIFPVAVDWLARHFGSGGK
jgi:hypothetical protein